MKTGEMIRYNSMLFFVALGLLISVPMLKAQGQLKNKTRLADVSYSIPQQPEDINPLLNGESIPMVMLKDVSGKAFDLNKALC